MMENGKIPILLAIIRVKYGHKLNRILVEMKRNKWSLLGIRIQVTCLSRKRIKHSLWSSLKNYKFNNKMLNKEYIRIHLKNVGKNRRIVSTTGVPWHLRILHNKII